MLPAIPELLALPLLVLTAAAEPGAAASARSRWWIVAAILALPVLQLVPLPPSIWSALPGRAPVADAYAAAGLALPWQPISLTPGATERIGLALLPALALFLTVPHLAADARRRLTHLAILIGVCDVLLGIGQIAGGPDSPLRLYATASRTDAVGLFANRNHHATFLALLILLAGALLADGRCASWVERAWLSASGALMPLGIAASGSRAGLALGAGACLALAWMPFAHRRGALIAQAASGSMKEPAAGRGCRDASRPGGPPYGSRVPRWHGLPVWGGLAAALAATGLVFYGSTVLRVQADAVTGDLRWQIARTTWQAIADVFPIGGGLGSFERLYARVERPDELIAAVVNNAHNDWLELVLEGGLPALLLLLAALGYLVHATFAAAPRSEGAPGRSVRSASLAALWLCALHESVDYPLRTMAVNVLLALACGLRVVPADASSGDRDRARRPRRATGALPGFR